MTGPAAAASGAMSADVRQALRRLSVLSLLSCLFALAPTGDAYRWLDVSAVSAGIAVVAGLLGLAASRGGRSAPAVAAGALCLVAAAVRLIALALEASAPIGGSGSTMTFLAGIGLGFLVLGLADRLPH